MEPTCPTIIAHQLCGLQALDSLTSQTVGNKFLIGRPLPPNQTHALDSWTWILTALGLPTSADGHNTADAIRQDLPPRPLGPGLQQRGCSPFRLRNDVGLFNKRGLIGASLIMEGRCNNIARCIDCFHTAPSVYLRGVCRVLDCVPRGLKSQCSLAIQLVESQRASEITSST